MPSPVAPSVGGTIDGTVDGTIDDGTIDGRVGSDRLEDEESVGAAVATELVSGLGACEDDTGEAVILGAGTAFKASRLDCSKMSSSSLLTSPEVPIATHAWLW